MGALGHKMSNAGRETADVAMRPATRVTQLLRDWRAGDSLAGARLLDLAHSELHRMAKRQLRGERHQSLQPTALVNELYLRLIEARRVNWQDRAHFFAMSARLMRRAASTSTRRINRADIAKKCARSCQFTRRASINRK